MSSKSPKESDCGSEGGPDTGSEVSRVLEALVMTEVSDLWKLSCERVRLMAVLMPLAQGDAIKANFCLTFPRKLLRGEGGADTDEGSIMLVQRRKE